MYGVSLIYPSLILVLRCSKCRTNIVVDENHARYSPARVCTTCRCAELHEWGLRAQTRRAASGSKLKPCTAVEEKWRHCKGPLDCDGTCWRGEPLETNEPVAVVAPEGLAEITEDEWL